MKRITSFLLAIVLFAGLVLTSAPVAYAASDMGVSDDLVEVLKQEEGFTAKPYWDYSQYTIGYGTRCPSDMVDYYKENGITKAAAETLLRNYLSSVENTINKKLIDKYNLKLTQGQFDALISFTYNCGSSWISDTDGTFNTAIRKGATGSELIRAFSLWCNAGGQILPGLVRRRLSEANMYLNGKYSRTQPDNYCYVYYNANGGSVSYRIQGYDANEGVGPAYTPTYSGHKFVGWYTAKTGGTKVTKLTKGLSGDTLYARWDEEGQVDPPASTEGVKITVTGRGVNLRKGPGTNYSIVGTADKGDTYTVTETDKCSTYTWGKIGTDKWICLKYTNYDAVAEEKEDATTPPETTAPETTKPETTAPETTKPETTKPETTKPEATEPETTKPETTKPESTEPEVTEPETTKPETTQPEATEPETTQPEATEPETTEPETTVPETTKPKPTEPKPTEPKPTEQVDNTKVTGKVATKKLLVRKGPGTSYGVAKTITKGTKVTITQRKTVNGIVWGKISSGWISVRNVTLDKNTPATTTPETTKPDANEQVDNTKVTGKVATKKLLVRKGPGTSYATVKTIKKGTKVTITQRKTVNGIVWGKISSGWISVRNVTLDKATTSTTTPTTNTTAVKLTGKVKVSDSLTVRKGAGTSYAVVKYLSNGTEVTITEKKTVGGTTWGKISSGWISMDYVVLDKESTTTQTAAKKTVIADCLRVRASASTSAKIVGYYYEGAKVTILETKKVGSTTWGKTSKGWISMAYVK